MSVVSEGGVVGFEVSHNVDEGPLTLLASFEALTGERVQLVTRSVPFAPGREVAAGQAYDPLGRWVS